MISYRENSGLNSILKVIQQEEVEFKPTNKLHRAYHNPRINWTNWTWTGRKQGECKSKSFLLLFFLPLFLFLSFLPSSLPLSFSDNLFFLFRLLINLSYFKYLRVGSPFHSCLHHPKDYQVSTDSCLIELIFFKTQKRKCRCKWLI